MLKTRIDVAIKSKDKILFNAMISVYELKAVDEKIL